MGSFTCVGKGGILSPSSFMKTDWNWSINFSAFPLPSVTKWFPDFKDFKGETPILSSFLNFTYFQKGFELFCFRPSFMVLFMSALRSSRLLSRWHLRQRVQFLVFLALLYSLAFRLKTRLDFPLIHGVDVFVLNIFDGIVSFIVCSDQS